MDEPEEGVVVIDVEDDGFAAAVRVAVRPIVTGLIVLIAIVTLAGGITIGALVVQARSIVHARADGTVRTCGSDQYFEIHHNALAATDQDVWGTALNDSAKTKPPAQRPAIIGYGDNIVARYGRTKVAVRGCSDAAIKAYVKWRTEHPTGVACESDSHGYCKVPPTVTP
jgi:hypothetical protein